jgi:hypothetical protein
MLADIYLNYSQNGELVNGKLMSETLTSSTNIEVSLSNHHLFIEILNWIHQSLPKLDKMTQRENHLKEIINYPKVYDSWKTMIIEEEIQSLFELQESTLDTNLRKLYTDKLDYLYNKFEIFEEDIFSGLLHISTEKVQQLSQEAVVCTVDKNINTIQTNKCYMISHNPLAIIEDQSPIESTIQVVHQVAFYQNPPITRDNIAVKHNQNYNAILIAMYDKPLNNSNIFQPNFSVAIIPTNAIISTPDYKFPNVDSKFHPEESITVQFYEDLDKRIIIPSNSDDTLGHPHSKILLEVDTININSKLNVDSSI